MSPWVKRLMAWLSGLLIAVLMVVAWRTGWRGFFSHPARSLTALLWLLVRRMGVEERYMLEQFGDSYRSHMARTQRLIPGVY